MLWCGSCCPPLVYLFEQKEKSNERGWFFFLSVGHDHSLCFPLPSRNKQLTACIFLFILTQAQRLQIKRSSTKADLIEQIVEHWDAQEAQQRHDQQQQQEQQQQQQLLLQERAEADTQVATPSDHPGSLARVGV